MNKAERHAKLELERIVFIGRTYKEYLDMFLLTEKELQGKKVLDCPAGACSFTAAGNKNGLDVTACDIAYFHPAKDLKNKGLQDLSHAMAHMQKAKDNYVWDYFKDIEQLQKHRLSALMECSADRLLSEKRYIPAALPFLPFADGEFDLLLSAHFLFMYADRLDYQFHIDTLNELLRVTKEEVRIFPLVDLEGNRYKYLEQLITWLDEKGCHTEEVAVAYEFQKNASTMLKINKAKGD